MENNKRIIFEVDDKLHHKIKLAAFKGGLTIKAYLTRIITYKLERDAAK